MMTENEVRKERMILVAVCQGREEETMDSLDELKELAKTAGVDAVASLMQRRENPDPGTYIGSGKIEETRQMLDYYEADGIITDDELSPAQLNNLADLLDCKVIDRTLLILDIFAARARTSEGKIQVELAQLKYRQQRLVGLRRSLSRLGGGIGTRGPGEKKLEMDRRLIQSRIAALNRDLEDVKKHRQLIRKSRLSGHVRTAALVGYTNAGKSTLMNALTDAEVYADDLLFATLDPTTRMMKFQDGGQVLLSDTVGFIRKLPHNLIDAFRSTLEEAVYADIIVHVADASSPQMQDQCSIVYDTLKSLGVQGKPIITLYNKQDRLTEEQKNTKFFDPYADRSIRISAKTGQGLDEFKIALEQTILAGLQLVEVLLPYSEGGKASLIREAGQVVSEDYGQDGIRIRAYLPEDIAGKLRMYQVK